MKISVLVPVYGVEKYIEACATSLMEQTYEDLEYVFVDDCSPDRSVERLRAVVERYPRRKPSVRIVRHDRNRGLGAARSTALAHATGEFLMWVDSDDVVATDTVEKLVGQQQLSGADIVDGAFCRLTVQGLGPAITPFHGDKTTMLSLLLLQNTLPHQLWARLVRRSLYTDNGIDFAEGINLAEDYSVIPRLLFCGSRSYIDDVVYYYRDSDVSTFKYQADRMEPRHLHSFIGANAAVCQFFQKRDKEGTYRLPLQIGMFKVYYMAQMNARVSAAEVDRRCQFRLTQPLLRCCRTCFSRSPRLMRLAYLAAKWWYKKLISCSCGR